MGVPLDQPEARGQAEFTMASDARELLVEVKGPGSEETGAIEVYLASHPETAFCIQARLHRRRCVEAGKQDCDANFLAAMTGHVDTCAGVEGLNPRR